MAESGIPADIRDYSVNVTDSNANTFVDQVQDEVIRASVDALSRDDTSEISRDPRTKRLLTRRERLARP